MKMCSLCLVEKPLSEFQKNGRYLKSRCNDCIAKLDKEYRKKNIDRIRKRNREYSRKNWRKFKYVPDPKKQTARYRLRYAVRAGKIKKGTHCHDCGKQGGIVGKNKKMSELVADHYLGYDEKHWYDVQWVCRVCDAQRELKRKNK